MRRRGLELEPRRTRTGTKGKTPDTAKGSPTGHRASALPYQGFVLWVSHQGIDVLHPTVESPGEEHGFAYYPDPEHAWDGGSLP